jgi:phosphotransferase system enzyme I (PtsP)
MKTASETIRAPQRRSARADRGRGLMLLEEVGTVIGQSEESRSTLQEIVALVAGRLDMEVCSVYRYDQPSDDLVMVATRGLDPESVTSVRMGVHEGLTGFVIERREPVMAVDALAHPRYKYFPETGEERYHSFLGVPILDKRQVRGVLVAQTSRRRRFTLDEVRLLKAVAVPVGGILAQLELLESLETKEEERKNYKTRMLDALKRLQGFERQREITRKPQRETAIRLSGWPAAPGFGIGRAHLLAPVVSLGGAPERRVGSTRREIARFQAAVDRSIEEIVRLKARVQRSYPEIDAGLFDTQSLMLADENLLGPVAERIAAGVNAERALEEVVVGLVEKFTQLESVYMQERAFDIKDIGQRVLRNLLGVAERDSSFAGAVVLVADELSLSDFILIESEQLKGIVMGRGGATSHASILAKSLELPTVVGVENCEEIREGDHLIVDGNSGSVFVNPSKDVLREYGRLRDEYSAFNRELDSLRDLVAETPDGHRVALGANIGLLGDIPIAQRHGADHIGLYRTEIAFLSHRDYLSEAEQVQLYERVVRCADGCELTVRTLDLGADKLPSYMAMPDETNPFLGWRSIRISLELPKIFKAQLRAIMRASVHGKARLLLPMVSSLEELRRSKAFIEEAKDELRRDGHEFDANIPVGVMIEVPAAVQMADRFITEVDFFSIGTNDLIQYMLAVDRNNRKVAALYQPLHPAVLRALATTVAVAQRAGKRVALCGEMAGDPVCTLVLLGLGLRDLSMSSFLVPPIKRLIRCVDMSTAEKIANTVLQLDTVKEVKRHVFEQMRQLELVDLMEAYH